MRSASGLSDTNDPGMDPETLQNLTDNLGSGNVQDYQKAVEELPNMTSSQPGVIPDELDAYLEGPWDSSGNLPTGWQPSAQAAKIGETLNSVIRVVDDPKMKQALGVFRDRIKAEIATAKSVKTPAQRQQYQTKIKGLLNTFFGSVFGGSAKKGGLQAKVKGGASVFKKQTAAIQKKLQAIKR